MIGKQRAAGDVPDPDPDDWYANLLWLSGRKCLLATHSATLFTVFEPDVTAAGLRSTGTLLTGLIRRELAHEELPLDTFPDTGQHEVVLTTTADRRVVGSMVDMAKVCQYIVEDFGGLGSTDLPSLNHHLNSTPFSARNYRRPLDLVVDKAG